MPLTYDVLVIGGGIHGLASAALAAANGLKVILIEKNNLASATSSASSKLIHGGLRYIEQGEIRLVQQSIAARQELLKLAPHLVHPLAFVLPINEFSRPKWQIRFALTFYDFFIRNGGFPKSRFLSTILDNHFFQPLKSSIQQAGLYFDAQAEDTRLVIENALRARKLGVDIHTHTEFNSVKVVHGVWEVSFTNLKTIKTKAIINTSGPWVNDVLTSLHSPHIPIRWVKGSHLVLPALYAGKHAYILQNKDKRVIFCIPYHGFTLVGTTDVNIKPEQPIQIDKEEINYLFATVSEYFKVSLRYEDIRCHWSGVRTCIDIPGKAAQKLSRDTFIHYSKEPAPIVSLYGGKLTTHQSTAKKILSELSSHFTQLTNIQAFDNLPFPGATTPKGFTYENYIHKLTQTYQWVPSLLLKRYINLYGTRIALLLKNCKELKDLGKQIAPDVYAREIEFLFKEEWARSADDILWRRTKLGLTLTHEEQTSVQDYIHKNFN